MLRRSHPDYGLGTAFVISRKYRLLATNAHVADIMAETGSLLVICNGNNTVQTVDRVWYHPGVLRRCDGSVVIRSQDPLAGPVSPDCPDVAVLHVAEGAELPAEFPLAAPEELRNLFSQSVAMLGFPTHDTRHWPAEGHIAQASFQEGAINRISDFAGDVNAPRAKLQMVQHSMAGWFGMSGSPIFVPNGHVVAINASRVQNWRGKFSTSRGCAVQVDCLWELLVYHNLVDQVNANGVRPTVDISQYQGSAPREAEIQAARRLVESCAGLTKHKQYAAAVEYCNQALRIAPDYARARLVRSRVLGEHAILMLNSGFRDMAKSELETAIEDAVKYERASAEDDHWGELEACRYALWIEITIKGDPSNERVTERINRLLGSDAFEAQQRAYAHRLRASAVNSARTSFADLNESLRLAPYGRPGHDAYVARSAFWQKIGDPSRAQADIRRAEQLLNAETLMRDSGYLGEDRVDREQLTGIKDRGSHPAAGQNLQQANAPLIGSFPRLLGGDVRRGDAIQ